jgi:hypothetical protein
MRTLCCLLLPLLLGGCPRADDADRVYLDLQLSATRPDALRITASSMKVGPRTGDNTNWVPAPATFRVRVGAATVTLARVGDDVLAARYEGDVPAYGDAAVIDLAVAGKTFELHVDLVPAFAAQAPAEVPVGQGARVTWDRAAVRLETRVSVTAAGGAATWACEDCADSGALDLPASAFPAPGMYRVRVQKTRLTEADRPSYQLFAASYLVVDTEVAVR